MRRFLLRRRSPPTSTARSTSSTPRTSRAATCSPTSAASVGERYILGNRNFTLDRLFADLARLSGVEPPALKLPLPAALALARAAEPAARAGPPSRTVEVRASSLWWTFRSTKAKRELGWTPAPTTRTR